MKKTLCCLSVLLTLIFTSCGNTSISISTSTNVIASSNKMPISTTTESNINDSKIKEFKDLLTGDYVINDSFKDTILNLKSFDNKTVISNAIYASNNGTGNGTKSNPYSIQDAIDNAKPGDTIYMLGGTYNLSEEIYLSCNGSKDKYITIRNNPGDEVIITSSKTSGEVVLFSVEGSYIEISGLSFKNVTASNAIGIAFWEGGQSNVIIRNNTFSGLKTTKDSNPEYGANAILMMGESSTKSISNIYIAENTITDNVIGYSEAISCSGNCEGIYYVNNRMTNNTNISMDFYGNAGYCKDPKYDQPRYCIAYGNVIDKSNSKYADCAGIYVDGARDVIIYNNEVYDSQYGIEIGSEERNDSYPVKNIIVENNNVHNNTKCGIRIGGFEKNETGVVQSTIVKNNSLKNNNNEFIINKSNDVTISNNNITVNNMLLDTEDFDSSYIKNLKFINNTVLGKTGKIINYFGNSYTLDEYRKLN